MPCITMSMLKGIITYVVSSKISTGSGLHFAVIGILPDNWKDSLTPRSDQ